MVRNTSTIIIISVLPNQKSARINCSILGAVLKTPLFSSDDRLCMTLALIFVSCDYVSLSKTMKVLKKVRGVIESNATSGAYDAILKVKANSEAELGNIVRNVAAVSGVIAIVTSIVVGVK